MQVQCATESETTANTASVGKQPGKTSTGVPGETVQQANQVILGGDTQWSSSQKLQSQPSEI